jgi:hypothetical protein
MPPGFLNSSARAEQAIYLIVYHGEYEVADVKSVEDLISRYIVQEIGHAQDPRGGILFSSSKGLKS